MKLSATFCATIVLAAGQTDERKKKGSKFFDNKLEAAQAENRLIEGADGNVNNIEIYMQFLFDQAGEDWRDTPRQMLNYGCYCQLIARHTGVGEPIDAIDEACRAYQHCSKCNGMDNPDFVTQEGESCTWVNARYEIARTEDKTAFECIDDSSDGVCGKNQCKCDVTLAEALFEARGDFKQKFSTENGFEFNDECMAVKPPPGNGGGDFTMECCGDYPTRFPFKQTEKRQCCVDKVYTTSKNCCNDGELTAGKC